MLIGESRNKQIQNIKVNKFIEDLAFLWSIAPTSRKVNITWAEYRKMFTDLIIEANKLIQ
jgi:hypothetical protein